MCPAKELGSVLRHSEAVKELYMDVGKVVSHDPICA